MNLVRMKMGLLHTALTYFCPYSHIYTANDFVAFIFKADGWTLADMQVPVA